jgi:beta-glucanase (GH16 family)
MARLASAFVLFASLLNTVLAAAPTCSETQKCPSDTPCCSRRFIRYQTNVEYGECGIGSYCLGGCDPRYSYTIDSCMPAPVCKSKTYTFENISKSLADYSSYLGDPSTADWTYSGNPLQYGDNVLLTMPANSGGTVIMSTEYVWYGQVSCTMKTSESQGVVTAFMYFPSWETS